MPLLHRRNKECDTTTIQDFIADLKNKFALPPTFGPPMAGYVPPRPRPIPVPPTNANPVPSEQPVASLVGTHNNSKGRFQDAGSLVGGR